MKDEQPIEQAREAARLRRASKSLGKSKIRWLHSHDVVAGLVRRLRPSWLYGEKKR